jgi:hypothetical protein
MPLPTLSKTWQLSINQTVTAQGSVNATAQRILRTIKNLMKGFGSSPWTCSGSSNAGGTTGSPTGSAAMDGVDRWTTDADLVGTPAGSNSRHGWIVLRQTGIATNYEICWDIFTTSQPNTMVAIISPSAGFTGGSATARPTATDEIVIFGTENPSTPASWGSGVDAQHQIHVWQSSDGQCTRIVVWRASTNLCTFWLFDKPTDTVSNWTNPGVSGMYAVGSGIAITYANLSPNSTFKSRSSSTVTFTPKFSGESDTNGLLANTTDIGTIANDFDGNWPFFPIGLYSTNAGSKGRIGNIFDLWWRPSGVSSGDTFPNNASTRQFIAMGPLILPWTGDSTTALLI